MSRFTERVLDLQRHFGQANADIEKILTSSERIATRGRKIETLEFEETAPAAEIEEEPEEVEGEEGAEVAEGEEPDGGTEQPAQAEEDGGDGAE